jgi:uncharacterized protein (TIGR03435 family)
MNSARRNARQALDQLLKRNPIPSTAEMQSRLDNLWERLRSEIENTATEHVSISVSIRPYWVFGKAPWVVAGLVLVVTLVSAVVWRNGPPFSTAFRTSNADELLSKSSSQRGAETLQITIPDDAFELASVKLVPPSSEEGQLASMLETAQLKTIGCPGGSFGGRRLDPGRLTIPSATVLSLVMLAYGLDCRLVDGGPAWARSGEYYEIQALLPAGTPRYTLADFVKGNAPQIQRMLQNLLAERFHLVLKRELREMPVYAVTVANPGKLKLSSEETLPLPDSFLGWQSASSLSTPGTPLPPAGRGQLMSVPGATFGHAVSMADLVRELRRLAGRFVVDKTGRSDVFDVDLKFARNTAPTAAPPVSPQSIPPVPGEPPQSTPASLGVSFQDALEEQLGLKLEAVRMPLEILVIERVERPSAN